MSRGESSMGVAPLQAENKKSMLESVTSQVFDRTENMKVSPHRDLKKNKLASLEATLVRNSAHPLTHLLTHRGKV